MAFIIRNIFHLFVIGISFLLPIISSAQSEKKFTLKMTFKEIGLLGGFGYGIDKNSLPEGNYSPTNFSAQFAYKGLFLRDDTVKGREDFLLFFEPMYNYVVLKSENGHKQEWDAGVTSGIKYNYRLLPSLQLSFQVGSGPHWYSATTYRQAPGFLFSNQISLGLYQAISKKLAVSFMFRIRHMSNADTRQPNHGINTNNYIWGLTYKL